MRPMKRQNRFEYDLVLSFAGEDRKPVERVYQILRRHGVRVFYDKAEQTSLWGKNLYEHLQRIYRDKARFCAVFISKHYAKKRWTRHELRQAQERAFNESKEYILPIRLDATRVPGLNKTTGYVTFGRGEAATVANFILKKLGHPSFEEDDLGHLGWDGRYVQYNGHKMASYWPRKIKAAQKLGSLRLLRSTGRIRYGGEAEDWGANNGPCHDCGVVKGQFHVPGCDVERCPSCGTQLISCSCEFENDFR
jgi:hypothetical protein